MQEKDLLEQLHTDPDRGMEALIGAYGGLVTALIRRILPASFYSEEDVEDCAAESFSEAYFHLQDFRERSGSLKAWLCVIARNNARDLMRRRRKEDGMLSLDAEDLPEPVSGFSVEDDLERKETRRALLDALNALGEPDREIVVRKYYLGESSRNIATRLNLTPGAVDVRTYRAVRQLRELLGGQRP